MAKKKKTRSSQHPKNRSKQVIQHSGLPKQRTKQSAIGPPVSWGWSCLDDSFPPNGGPKKANDKYWQKLVDVLATLEKHPRIRGLIGVDLGNDVCGLQKVENLPSKTDHRWRELVRRRPEWREVTQLYRFRLGGIRRAYALPPNDDGVSYVLWIDPSHEVWPSSQ